MKMWLGPSGPRLFLTKVQMYYSLYILNKIVYKLHIWHVDLVSTEALKYKKKKIVCALDLDL